MKLSAIFLFFIIPSFFSQEENDWRLFPNKEEQTTQTVLNKNNNREKKELTFDNNPGTITIIQPKAIDSLTNHHKNTPYILGYTVQLEVSQQTSKIRDARYRLLKIKPNAPLEETWLPPNTYLYGGAFYSRTDAYKFKNDIKSYFPTATVIAKKLSLPPLSKLDDQ